MVLPGYFKALTGDHVDKASSTLFVCGPLNFAKCVHVHHSLIILSVELGGLEAGYDHLFMDGEIEA